MAQGAPILFKKYIHVEDRPWKHRYRHQKHVYILITGRAMAICVLHIFHTLWLQDTIFTEKKYCSTPKILWDFWYIIWSTKLHKFQQVSFLLQLVVGFVKIELDWLDYMGITGRIVGGKSWWEDEKWPEGGEESWWSYHFRLTKFKSPRKLAKQEMFTRSCAMWLSKNRGFNIGCWH